MYHFLFEIEEIEELKAQESKESEADELLGDLNPRFFEEATSLKETRERVQASQGYSNFSFNTYGF